MKEEFIYTPDNHAIFEGFYESHLYNSDMEYYYNLNLGEDKKPCEIRDFKGYCEEICKGIADLLLEYFDTDICDKCEFDSLTSPREYNFSTDNIHLKLNIDLDFLKNKILRSKNLYKGFDKYLKEKYSSRSGFISYVADNIDEYFNKSYREYPDVMIDYYLLTKICDTADIYEFFSDNYIDTLEYEEDIQELVDDVFDAYLVEIND